MVMNPVNVVWHPGPHTNLNTTLVYTALTDYKYVANVCLSFAENMIFASSYVQVRNPNNPQPNRMNTTSKITVVIIFSGSIKRIALQLLDSRQNDY